MWFKRSKQAEPVTIDTTAELKAEGEALKRSIEDLRCTIKRLEESAAEIMGAITELRATADQRQAVAVLGSEDVRPEACN